MSRTSPQSHRRHLRRLALDLGPLALFFGTYKLLGNFFVATGVFMATILASLAMGYAAEKRLSPMPVVTALLVLVFGGLTIGLKSEVFLKIKPTVLYTFFSALLLGGLAFNRLFIKYIFEQAFDLTETGWRSLTWRWGLFFVFLAVLNEIVWRNMSTDFWVSFKFAGVLPLTFLFALAQTPFVLKHQIEHETPKA
jgi:intracellular septation protein